MSVTVEIYFDTRLFRKKTKDYPYKLRVYHAGEAKLFPTVLGLSKEDNDKLGAKNLGARLQEIRDKLAEIERSATNFAKGMDPFSFKDFIRDFIKDNPIFVQTRVKTEPLAPGLRTFDFSPFYKKFPILQETPEPGTIGEVYLAQIKAKLANGKVKTAMNYQCAYNSLKQFGGNVRFKVITAAYLRTYADWMKNHTDEVKKRKCSKTTIGMYLITLRTMFNEAIHLKIIKKEGCYPFGKRQFMIPGSNNTKKAFDQSVIERIYYYECDPKRPSMQKARSFWFFMYFGQGMNPKDICLLQYKNITGEFLEFERAKTEDSFQEAPPRISVFLSPDMLQTIADYGNKDKSPENYIFPIFERGVTPLQQYEIVEYFTKFINKWMQYILNDLEIDRKAGCQVARHTYSTMRRLAGASLLEIGEELGHKKPETTKRYVGSLPYEQKKENAKQLESFKRNNSERNAITSGGNGKFFDSQDDILISLGYNDL
jgi:integrase/recombinase XerD